MYIINKINSIVIIQILLLLFSLVKSNDIQLNKRVAQGPPPGMEGIPPPPGAETKIEVGGYYMPTVLGVDKANNYEHEVYVQMLNTFLREYPEWDEKFRIIHKKCNKNTIREYHDELRSKLNETHFMLMDSMYLNNFEDSLLDLTPYFQEGELDFIQPDLLEQCKINGKLYALPFTVEYGMLYARTDILATYNYTLSEINTWEKLIEVAGKITRSMNNSAIFGYVGQFSGEYLVSNIMEWIYSFRDQGYNGNLDFSGDNVKEALEMVKSLMEHGISSEAKEYNKRDSAERWLGKEALFLRHSPYLLRSTRDLIKFEDSIAIENKVVSKNTTVTEKIVYENGEVVEVTKSDLIDAAKDVVRWDYRLLPGKYEGNSASTQTLFVHAVNKDTEYPEMIIKAIKYMSSKGAQTAKADVISQFPVTKSISNDTTTEIINNLLENMNIIQRPFRTKFYPDMSKRLQTLTENYLGNEKGYTVDKVVDYLRNMGKIHYVEFLSIPSLIILIVTALSILFTIGVAAHLIYFRDSKIIQRSSPIFGFLMVCGALLAMCSIVLYIDKPSSLKCGLQTTTLTLGFALCFSSLLVKNYRIYKIFKNPNLRRLGTSISNSFLLIIVIVIVLCEALIQALYLMKSKPTAVVELDSEESALLILKCKSDDSFSNVVLACNIGFNGILFIIGMYLAFQTRSVISEYNESKHIAFSIYTVLLCCIIWIPLTLIKYNYFVSFIMKSVVILICSVTIISVMFVPKIYMLYKKPKNEYNFYDYQYNNHYHNNSTKKMTAQNDEYIFNSIHNNHSSNNNSSSNMFNNNNTNSGAISHGSSRISQSMDHTKMMRGLLPVRIERNQLMLPSSEWVNKKVTLIMGPKLMAIEAENANEQDRKLKSMINLQIFCIEPLFSQNIIRIHIDNEWIDIQTPNASECLKWKEAFEYGKHIPEQPLWNEEE